MVAISEGDLIRAARLRELFGIKQGQSVESAIHYRDKIKMKERLKSKKINVPIFIKAENATDIIQFAQTREKPENFESFVIKPSCGMSSVNTTAIRSDQDLEKFFKSGILEKLTEGMDINFGLDVEKFVHGPM